MSYSSSSGAVGDCCSGTVITCPHGHLTLRPASCGFHANRRPHASQVIGADVGFSVVIEVPPHQNCTARRGCLLQETICCATVGTPTVSSTNTVGVPTVAQGESHFASIFGNSGSPSPSF